MTHAPEPPAPDPETGESPSGKFRLVFGGDAARTAYDAPDYAMGNVRKTGGTEPAVELGQMPADEYERQFGRMDTSDDTYDRVSMGPTNDDPKAWASGSVDPAVVSHRPSDAYRAQLETYEWFRTHKLARQYADLVEATCTNSEAGTGAYYKFVLGAFQGETYWVSPEMVDVLEAAHTQLPDYTLDLDTIPSRSGVAYFARDLRGTDANDANNGTCLVGAIAWYPATISGRPCITIASYSHLATVRRMAAAAGEELPGHRMFGWPPLDSLGFSDWPVTDAISDTGKWLMDDGIWQRPATAKVVASATEDRQLLSALWLLSAQRMADVRQERIDRPTRRNFQREGVRLVRDHLTVIRLRKPTEKHHEPGEHREVNWSHQWVVGGHWRDQWYASSQTHRPIWISPYVKGPEDKPFDTGGSVKAWVR